MLCKNPDCGIYRLTYDVEYDADKDPNKMPCTFCGELLSKTGSDILEIGVGNLVKERRPAQLEYAHTIDMQFAEPKSVTFIEGGTGVGKSYAYIIPVVLELLKDRTARAIIVTSNKALQKQLTRDFPKILAALGAEDEDVVSYALLKGRNNYACPALRKEVPDNYKRHFDAFLEKYAGRPADIDNWPSHIEAKWWGKISTDNCPKPGVCKYDCYGKNARKARIIITNYHYFGTFLRFPGVLDDGLGKRAFKFLVMDEAHQAVASLRSAFQAIISPGYLGGISSELQRIDLIHLTPYIGIKEQYRFLAEKLDTLAKNLKERLDVANTTSRPTFNEIPNFTDNDDHKYNFAPVVLTEIKQYVEDLEVDEQLTSSTSCILKILESTVITEKIFEENPDGCTIRARLINKLKRLNSFLIEARTEDFYASKTAALDPRGLSLIPVDIGTLIRPALNKQFRHIVVTSATLAQNGNDFSYMRSSLGYNRLEDDVVEKVVGSPFDYRKAARLYIPRMDTIPAKGGFFEWYDDIANEIVALATASVGDGFVLFSSAKDLREVADRTRGRLEEAGIPVLTQSNGIAADALTKQYHQTPNAMLYGLKSFWEGVDIQGSKLRLVIIPKLPFPVPDDPIIRALTVRAGSNSFMEVSVPIMLEAIRQGAGRLIRSQTDMGVVAILDSRFWTGTSNLMRHKAHMKNINFQQEKSPMGYGVKIYRSLGLILIDSQDYACTLLKKTITLFNKLKSA
jgi:Rad3-related DNA helicase